MSAMTEYPKRPDPETREELYRSKRGKNLAVLALILAFFVLFYLITIFRMS